MPISLTDVVKYYSGVNYQTQALKHLQQQIESNNPDLLAETSDFVRLWRNQAPVEPEFMITSDGIGPAKVGQTYGQIKQALGSAYHFSDPRPYLVGSNGIEVSRKRSDEDQFSTFSNFSLLFQSEFGQDDTNIPHPEDDTIIDTMITSSASYKTAEGIGPGSLISEAVKKYGNVTLGYNTDNESREFARFERGPADNIGFSPRAISHNYAGDYSVPNAVRRNPYKTTAFFENACVYDVWVTFRGNRQ